MNYRHYIAAWIMVVGIIGLHPMQEAEAVELSEYKIRQIDHHRTERTKLTSEQLDSISAGRWRNIQSMQLYKNLLSDWHNCGTNVGCRTMIGNAIDSHWNQNWYEDGDGVDTYYVGTFSE